MTNAPPVSLPGRVPESAFETAPLWIVGFFFLAVFLPESVFVVPPGDAYRLHWLVFIFVGLVTPALLALTLRSGKPRLIESVKVCAIAFLGCWIARFLLGDRSYVLLLLGGEAAMLWACGAFGRISRKVVVATLVLGVVGWIVMMPIGLEVNLIGDLSRPVPNFSHLVLLSALAFSTISLARPASRVERTPAAILALWFGIALVASVILAYRFTTIFGVGPIHHWAFWVGPAFLVRQGGWLLWDVPSQYGYLNELAIALMPRALTWDAMRMLECGLLAVGSVLLFWLLMQRTGARFRFVFALAAAIGIVVMSPGSASNTGYLNFPDVGPLRFFWPWILIAIVAKIYISKSEPRRTIWVRVGTLAWLVGSLWSAESAIYCTFTWVPAIVLDRFVRTNAGTSSVRAAARAAARRLAKLSSVAVAAIAAIDVLYLCAIHHPPDWYAFVEFGLLYTSGIARYDPDPYGSFWLVLLVLSLIAAAAITLVRARKTAGLPLLVASWGAVFATSSYYVMRSANGNVNPLLPGMAFALAALLLVIDREGLGEQGALLRRAMIPFFAWTATLTFANTVAWQTFSFPLFPGYAGTMMMYAPPVDPHIVALRARVHARDDDRYLTVVPPGFDQFEVWRRRDSTPYEPEPWLMIRPEMLFYQLPEARQREYNRRSQLRHRWSGWIIASRTATCADYVPNAVQSDDAREDDWMIAYCHTLWASTPNVARPAPLADPDRRFIGSLDQIDRKESSPNSAFVDEPVIVVRGGAFTVRGWLVRTNGAPLRGRLVARIDGRVAGTARYGLPRPDVARYLSLHLHKTIRDGTGFSFALPTTTLTSGAHTLQLLIRERTLDTPLGPILPFTVD